MHADARKLLWDAQQAAERIVQFTSGKAFTDYGKDDSSGPLSSASSRLSVKP